MSARTRPRKYGWKLGDRVPIGADIWMPKDGQTWYFNIDGIYDGDKNADKTQFLFRYDYFDENRRAGKGTVSWYVIKVARSVERRGDRGDARRQVREFAGGNQDRSPRKAVIADFAKQTGNIGAMITAVLSVVFFIILLVVANTMAQSVRERTAELAVLKTLGLLGRANPRPRARRIAGHFGRRRLGGARSHVPRLSGAESFNIAMLPVFVFQRARAGTRLDPRRAARPARRRAARHLGDASEDYRRPEEELTCFAGSARPLPSRCSDVRTVPQRFGASVVALIGIAGVVVVFVSVLSIGEGFRAALVGAGSPSRAIVMRNGSESEMTSGLTGPETEIVKQAPGSGPHQ